MTCRLCHKPLPREYCWEGRIDCWADKPPRHLSTQELWKMYKELQGRIDLLEERLDGS
jgi:hypothetical protein